MPAKPVISATQWRERAAALKPRSQVFIDGRFVPAANGATFDNINPATGRSLGAVAAGEQLDIDRAVASAPRRVPPRQLGAAAAEGAQEGAAEARRSHAGESRRAGVVRDAGHGQAHLRQPERRHPFGRELHSLVRRSGRQDLRRSRAHRAERARHDHARTHGRGRRHRAVEFPAADGVAGRSARCSPAAIRWCSSPRRNRR